jgi:hypothetical protein
MKYFFLLTGLLVSLTVGTILIGRQLIIAKEAAIKSEIQSKLLANKLLEVQVLQKTAKDNSANTVIIKKSSLEIRN